MNKLEKIMRQREIIYDAADGDQYEQSAVVAEIRNNCIVVARYCCVLDTTYEYYDRHLQLMHRVMLDDSMVIEYTETGIKVSCTNTFLQDDLNYTVDFSNGCFINKDDVVAVYYGRDENDDSYWYVKTNVGMWLVNYVDCKKVSDDVCLEECELLDLIPINVIDSMNYMLMMEIM